VNGCRLRARNGTPISRRSPSRRPLPNDIVCRAAGERRTTSSWRGSGRAPAGLDHRRNICGRAVFISLLEKDKPVPLEFIRFAFHFLASIRSLFGDGDRRWSVQFLPKARGACFEMLVWPYSDSCSGMIAGACDITPRRIICGALVRNGDRSTPWINLCDRVSSFIASVSEERLGVLVAASSRRRPTIH
jgi:hypothetical protein